MTKTVLEIKSLCCLFIMLMTIVLGFTFLPRVGGIMVISVVLPASGNVGSKIIVVANLTTANGAYNLTFDNAVVAFGNAIENQVNTTFVVPETWAGNHTLTVIDLANTTDTAIANFTVTTAYALNVTLPVAKQLQEGDSVPILLNVTGGTASITYDASITVQLPAGISPTFNADLHVLTSALGSGVATVTYPNDFPIGANTSYVGDYVVSSNITSSRSTFFVGLTNATQYHRMQAVGVKALYAPNEEVTFTVAGNGIQNSVNLTADSFGIIDYSNFTVPSDAKIGSYNVNLVSVSGVTKKDLLGVPDSQNFTVPGFAFNVTAKNLAGDTVSNAVLTALENSVAVSNQTSNANGTAVLMLEIGNYTLQGFSEGTLVGENQFGVNDTEAVDFVLNLTNMDIKVVALVNGVETSIPEAGIFLTPENLTLTTDINGNAIAHSLLPSNDYVLNVSRYDEPFNTINITGLRVDGSLVPVYNVTVVCPSYNLLVNVFKADGQQFGDAVVEVKEFVGGILYSGITGADGTVIFQNVTFGRYTMEILDNTGLELNGTTVDVFQDQNVTIDCNLCGLSISVTVTDYFGQPFANTNVTLMGNGSEPISEQTMSNGTATFANLVGDSFSVSVYLSNQGSAVAVQSLIVSGSTAVQITMSRYVLVAGFPLDAGQFAVAIVIVLSLLFIGALEVITRRRKSKTIES